MAKYRRKPTIVDAEPWHYGQDVRGVCRCEAVGQVPHVHTMHQNQPVALDDGDWIVAEPDGVHFYPIKASVFAATYEPAGEGDA